MKIFTLILVLVTEQADIVRHNTNVDIETLTFRSAERCIEAKEKLEERFRSSGKYSKVEGTCRKGELK